MNNNVNNFLLKDIKENEEIVIIDMLDCEESYSKIKYKIDIARKEEPKKIYIILEKERKGKIRALFIDDFQWNITINEIEREDKEKYVRNFLEKNNIEVYNEWISEISVKPYYEIKNILTNIIVQCTLKNNWKIIEEKDEKCEKNEEKTGYEELNELIGLDNVKEQIMKIVNYLKISKDRNNMPMLHMCFTGNPRCWKNMCS